MLPPVHDYQSADWTRAQQRGEDAPTVTDAVGLCLKAAVKLVCAIACATGVVLFSRDATTPAAPLAIALCSMMSVAFVWQAARAIRRAVRILRKQEVD